MFPIGEMFKKDVKRLAADIGFGQIADKKESMGICFIGKRDFRQFISEYIDKKPGDFVDVDTGMVIGQHDGFHNYTVGQRIPVAGKKDKMFVLRKMSDMKTMLVVAGHENELLYSDLVYTREPHWISRSPFEESALAQLKFCFQHIDPLEECKAIKTDRGILVMLKNPVRAITPGQFATLYRGDECLGSAEIHASALNFKKLFEILSSDESSKEEFVKEN